jgi:hypothetical protein
MKLPEGILTSFAMLAFAMLDRLPGFVSGEDIEVHSTDFCLVCA